MCAHACVCASVMEHSKQTFQHNGHVSIVLCDKKKEPLFPLLISNFANVGDGMSVPLGPIQSFLFPLMVSVYRYFEVGVSIKPEVRIVAA